MKDKRLTKEVLKMAAEADSVEALSADLAKAGVEATPEEIKTLFDSVRKELSDDMLTKITGGSSGNEEGDSFSCHWFD